MQRFIEFADKFDTEFKFANRSVKKILKAVKIFAQILCPSRDVTSRDRDAFIFKFINNRIVIRSRQHLVRQQGQLVRSL